MFINNNCIEIFILLIQIQLFNTLQISLLISEAFYKFYDITARNYKYNCFNYLISRQKKY